jgi:hypothetical protein
MTFMFNMFSGKLDALSCFPAEECLQMVSVNLSDIFYSYLVIEHTVCNCFTIV